MEKLIRITTVPVSLENLLEGQLNFMQREYEVIAISAEAQRLKKLGEKLGVRTYPVEMTREITPHRDIASLWDLYRFFKKEKPLIVHTHTPKAGIAGMIAAKMAGVPLRLHTLAGLPLLEARGPKRKLLELVEKITFSCATKVYPNSKRIHEYVLENNFAPEEKLKVLGRGSSNGIDTAFFDPGKIEELQKQILRRELKISKDDLIFVFVGRLVGDKGINELVNAFQRLHKVHSRTKLLLVGPFEEALDPLKPETAKPIRDNENIIEVGYQDDVRPYLAISDVLAFPSYREGFPNVVMQAGAMGLPAIVSDINGCNEIIIEGENGTIIPVKQTDALYEAMHRMLVDEQWRTSLAQNARRTIQENYERADMWKVLLAEYKTLEQQLKEGKK